MAFQPCPSVAEVAIRSLMGGRPLDHVLHFQHTDASNWDETELAALALQVATGYANNILAVVSNQLVLQEVVATDLSEEGGFTATDLTFAGNGGLLTGEPLPFQTALVVTLRTGRAGRSNHGRMYLGGFTEAQSSGRQVESSSLTAIRAEVSDMFDIFTGEALIDWCVLSRITNKVTRAEGVGTPITAAEIKDSIWDSQRRRQQ